MRRHSLKNTKVRKIKNNLFKVTCGLLCNDSSPHPTHYTTLSAVSFADILWKLVRVSWYSYDAKKRKIEENRIRTIKTLRDTSTFLKNVQQKRREKKVKKQSENKFRLFSTPFHSPEQKCSYRYSLQRRTWTSLQRDCPATLS
jgi:transposase